MTTFNKSNTDNNFLEKNKATKKSKHKQHLSEQYTTNNVKLEPYKKPKQKINAKNCYLYDDD